MCFGHAASCVYNDTVGGVCNCMDNTDGIDCGTCLPGFFVDGTVLPTDREVCKRMLHLNIVISTLSTSSY